ALDRRTSSDNSRGQKTDGHSEATVNIRTQLMIASGLAVLAVPEATAQRAGGTTLHQQAAAVSVVALLPAERRLSPALGGAMPPALTTPPRTDPLECKSRVVTHAIIGAVVGALLFYSVDASPTRR